MAGKSNIMREFLSVKELSAYTGICERTLRDMLNASVNPIPGYRFGGSIKIKRSEFDEWAKSRRIDNDRVDRIVNEVLTDFGYTSKRSRKSGSKVGSKKISK